MTIIRAGEQQTILVLEGRRLAVSGVGVTAGVIYQLDPALGGTNSSRSWAVNGYELPQLGPFRAQQRFLITCATGAIDARVVEPAATVPIFSSVAPAGPLPAQMLGAKRFEALFKPVGIAVSGFAFNHPTASLATGKFCTTAKYELEADVDAVRLVAVNRAPNAIGEVKALVGVTETADMSTSATLASPTIGGVSYQALQGATDVNGWRAVTWNGPSGAGIAAAPTAQQVTLSDWTPKGTIPRADGGVRPLYLVRPYVDGTASPVSFTGTYTAALRTPSAAMRGRIIQNSVIYNDGIAMPALTATAHVTGLEVYPIFRFRVPVLSVWLATDSRGQADALVADKTSTWVYRACLDLSTPEKPVVFANLSGSSQNTLTCIATLRTYLEAGVPAPSVLFATGASINDGPMDANLMEVQLGRLVEILRLCAKYGIPYPIFFPLLPNENYTIAQDNMRKAINARMKALAQAAGALWVDFPLLSDGGTPEKWLPGMGFDAFHESELGIELAMVSPTRAVLAPLI